VPFSVAAKNTMINNLGSPSVITDYKISAHTANPGSTGASECAGSTRATGTFAAAAGGSRAQTNAPSITGIDVADTVQYLGVWTDDGLTWLGYQPVTPTSSSGGSGTWSYDVAAGTIDLNELASA
jgi:hypothetical protein